MADSIRILHGALDEEDGDIILRGAIDPDSLRLLKVDKYQREILPLAKIAELMRAFRDGSVPDIDLGMRGHRVIERGGLYYLQDSVFIIDGLQRATAAGQLMQQDGVRPRLGATIHFGTTEPWERERFRILNAERTRLSSNILLRNQRHDVPAVDVMYRLGVDKAFVLQGRICWQQRMARSELITAMTFARVVGALHAHIGPGRSTNVDELARGLDKIMERTGQNVFRDNIRTFFDIVDEAWGIKRVVFKEGAVYIKNTFLTVLAMVFSRHTDFWRGDRLTVVRPLVRKLAGFPVSDPQVANLASASGKARDLLYLLMVDHINSGKRTRRLKERNNLEPIELPENGEPDFDS